MEIYFDGGNKHKDLLSLLNDGYTGQSYSLFKRTFSNAELTTEQCHIARRSFGDLLLIARTYFPETSEGELAYLLLYKVNKMSCFICPNIDKIVFISDRPSKKDNDLCNFEVINFGVTRDTKGVDELSFRNLKQMADEYLENHKPNNNEQVNNQSSNQAHV